MKKSPLESNHIDIGKTDLRKPETFEERRPAPKPQPKRSRMHPKLVANILVGIIILASVGLAAYFYYKLHSLERNTPNSSTTAEAQDLLAKVAKIYLIPQGEEPTIATVSDPSALKSQAFFADSQKDDKVLIFTKAGKAVLYRPSINKIIETAPINNDANTQTNAPDATSTQPSGSLKDKTF